MWREDEEEDKQLLDNLEETKRYWKLKAKALDRTLWRTRFGRAYGPAVRRGDGGGGGDNDGDDDDDDDCVLIQWLTCISCYAFVNEWKH